MEASGTVEQDAAQPTAPPEPERTPVAIAPAPSDDWRESAKKHFDIIRDKRRELKALRAEAKELKEEIADEIETVEKIVRNKPDPEQIQIPTATAAAEVPNPEICPHAGKGPFHDWKRIRVTDGIALEDCANCGLERTGRICDTYGAPVEPSWAYSEPAAAATNQDEAAASSDSGETHAPETPALSEPAAS